MSHYVVCIADQISMTWLPRRSVRKHTMGSPGRFRTTNWSTARPPRQDLLKWAQGLDNFDWFFDFDKRLILMDWRWPSKSPLSHSSKSHFSSALALTSRSPNSYSSTTLSPTPNISGNCQATMYNIRCKLYGVIQHLTDSIVIPLQWV